jgi:hypothetical protein
MNFEELKTYLQEKIKQYPKLKYEIMDLYGLCLSEIQEGGSVQQEIDSCINDVKDLISNQ